MKIQIGTALNISYDDELKALYLYVGGNSRSAIPETEHLSDSPLINVDRIDGVVVGIEIIL